MEMRPDPLTLAERVKFYRRRARLSQRALAREAGVGRQTIAAIEGELITGPTLTTLQAIARACGCSTRDLIPDTEPAVA
jgi:transcriptional regulator with XRE-family HTH domain